MQSGLSKQRERGASLVEFALIAPLLFLILIGTLTGGLTLSRHNSVKNAAREATRFGAVTPDFDAASVGELYDQVVSAATGDLDPPVEGRSVCVAFIEDDDTWTYELYSSSDSPDQSGSGAALASVPGACTDGFDATVSAGRRRVWVRAERTSEIEAILFSRDVTLDAASLSRYER